MEKRYIAYETGAGFLVGCVGTCLAAVVLGALCIYALPGLLAYGIRGVAVGKIVATLLVALLILPFPFIGGRLDERGKKRGGPE